MSSHLRGKSYTSSEADLLFYKRQQSMTSFACLMKNRSGKLRQYNLSVVDYSIRIANPLNGKVKKTLPVWNTWPKTLSAEEHKSSLI